MDTSRSRVAFSLLALVGVAVAISLWARRPGPAGPGDPSRFGPERTLALGALRVEPRSPGGFRLVGEGTTNLPDGATVDVNVRAAEGESVLQAVATARGGALAISAEGGVATNGSYAVTASFRLEAQSALLREALHYQPQQLEASALLVVSTGVDPGAEMRPKVKALIARANRARDSATLVSLGPELAALERELWLSTLTPALRRMRRALEAAIRERAGLARLRDELVAVDVLADR